MVITECYLCDSVLTAENESVEHILLNAIGGRLKSKELLCRKCNSEVGHGADSELSKQLLFLSNFLAIKRSAGENPAVKGIETEDGKFYNLVDGKPVVSRPTITKEIVDGNKVNLSVSAGNEQQMLAVLNGLKRKYPHLNLDEIKKHFQYKSEYINEPFKINTTVGGDLAFRSICKTAVNYYVYVRGEREQIAHLYNYLRGKENLKIAHHYYPNHESLTPAKDEISHLIYLVGEKDSKLLYCFIEFFSSFSFIVILSDNYSGNNFSSTYCYDVIQNVTIEKQLNFSVSIDAVSAVLKEGNNDFLTIQKKLGRVIQLGQRKHTNDEIHRFTGKAIEDTFNSKYKGQEVVTEEMIADWSEQIALAYVKFAFRDRKDKPSKKF